MTSTLDFEMLDDSQVPPTIKPMIKIHDLLVRGWRQDKEVKLPKLIKELILVVRSKTFSSGCSQPVSEKITTLESTTRADENSNEIL